MKTPFPTDKSFYLVCGDDEYRVDRAVRELVDLLVPETDREFSLDKIDGRVELVDETIRMTRAVRDALVADGLFGGGAKTVWLRDPAFLANDRVSKSEDVKNAVASLLAGFKTGLPEGCRLVVSTVKVNRAQAFFKFFNANGFVLDFGSGLKAREKNDAARAFLAERLAEIGLKMAPAAQSSFLAKVGTDSRTIASELDKLACYCASGATATEADVAAINSFGAVSEIWDFTDAFCNRDAKKLVRQIAIQLEQGENSIRLAQTILSSVSDLLFLHDAMDKGWVSGDGRNASWNIPPEIEADLDAAEKDTRSSLSGFRMSKALQQASRWRTSDLRAARHYVVKLREELVSTQLPESYLIELRLLQAIGAIR